MTKDQELKELELESKAKLDVFKRTCQRCQERLEQAESQLELKASQLSIKDGLMQQYKRDCQAQQALAIRNAKQLGDAQQGTRARPREASAQLAAHRQEIQRLKHDSRIQHALASDSYHQLQERLHQTESKLRRPSVQIAVKNGLIAQLKADGATQQDLAVKGLQAQLEQIRSRAPDGVAAACH